MRASPYLSEKAMAPHSSALACKIPWMGQPGGPAVHGVAKSRTRLSDFTFTFHFHALEKEMATHSSVLGWRILGTGEPGGLPSTGPHRLEHNWSNLAAAAAVLILSEDFDVSLCCGPLKDGSVANRIKPIACCSLSLRSSQNLGGGLCLIIFG